VSEGSLDDESRRVLHRTIEAVREGMETLRFNTSIARLTELTTQLVKLDAAPREAVEPLVLMLAPLAPHVSEELWRRLGRTESVTRQPFPTPDPQWTRREELTIPVQVKGKLRGTVSVPADSTDAELETAARAEAKVASYLAEGAWRAIVVPGRLVNFVPARPAGPDRGTAPGPGGSTAPASPGGR
jgi:leucyl-tRNA synthetase